MLAILARALFGVIALVGLGGTYDPGDRGNSDPIRQSRGTDAPRAASVPVAVIEPETELHYQPESLYRVYRVTAYCDRGQTAAGVPSGIGQCAAPADIPFGARIHIPALGRTFIVTDRTARRFRHNTVDLFIPDRDDCMSFGRQYLECEITIPADTFRYGSSRLHALLAANR
jgi:3D (Asp-Asp-Asp) domain-containing protein